MRISDWSSDGFSSDLPAGTFTPSAFLDTVPVDVHDALKARLQNDKSRVTTKGREGDYIKTLYDQRFDYVVTNFNEDRFILDHLLLSTLDRKSVVWGKRVSVIVDLGGVRLIKKK